jgi:deoxyadenosine/deoxycytidine kinase
LPTQHSNMRIVVVGPCASGKSTLVANLSDRGFDAYVCAQEHSAVPRLYLHQHPDIVVFLDVELEDIRQRRSPAWSAAIYEQQQIRLYVARSEADILVNTSNSDEKQTLEQVLTAISEFPRPKSDIVAEAP